MVSMSLEFKKRKKAEKQRRWLRKAQISRTSLEKNSKTLKRNKSKIKTRNKQGKKKPKKKEENARKKRLENSFIRILCYLTLNLVCVPTCISFLPK